MTWAGEVTNSDESLLGWVLALKCFQRMGRFPRDEEIPELVVDRLRRGLGLDAGVWEGSVMSERGNHVCGVVDGGSCVRTGRRRCCAGSRPKYAGDRQPVILS
ncbi:DUF4158 domain-containing protein [Pseudonocardia sp. DSM 110487]|uniref:DUF4158 domain-containing protein n=1 Tax=Pseudonocardia sp. DSM 110487 TaxID=2865833 RepID=UPI001C69B86D|nr:DUF4158 domain-containing protein [Pseudonocardia sp. DSM 110487]